MNSRVLLLLKGKGKSGSQGADQALGLLSPFGRVALQGDRGQMEVTPETLSALTCSIGSRRGPRPGSLFTWGTTYRMGGTEATTNCDRLKTDLGLDMLSNIMLAFHLSMAPR